MRIRDLRDWRICLKAIRQRLAYSHFQAAAGKNEEEAIDHWQLVSDETDRLIAEGMLHTVVSLPHQDVSLQLAEFASGLTSLQPDTEAEVGKGFVADAYWEFFRELGPVQRGLPAVVGTFKTYAESCYNTRNEPLDLLEEARHSVLTEPEEALRLVGEAGSLHLRGFGEVDELLLSERLSPLKEPLADWIEAVSSVLWSVSETLEEFPLGEIELARDQWRAPRNKKRAEYKKGKLERLGIVEPEVQALLLPLFAPRDQRLSGTERRAIMAAGPKAVPGLIAIAGDEDSQLRCSVSEGEAAIRAVELLGNMRAAEAVPTLLEILKNTDYLVIIHDRAIQVLQDEMPDLAFDTALDVFDQTTDAELKCEMAGVLANGGRGKPGVFERLIELFRKEKDQQMVVATYLADLGDPRALPDLHNVLRRAKEPFGFADIEEAIIQLGGELSAAEKQNLEGRRAGVLGLLRGPAPFRPAPADRPEPSRTATKTGRNEPCPCGSGLKYKKCCGR